MEFSVSPDVEAFARQVRAVLDEYFTDARREAMHASGTFHDWELHRAMAARGWLRAGLVGTDGSRDPFELAAFFAELEQADAPYHGLATTMIVAGVISHAANAALKDRVLPELLSGQSIAALGYSEPDHGSDVAAASTRAVPDADRQRWTINGQKMWTSLAHVAQYVLLLTRTDPDVPKHRGLTMFLVPLHSPGITIEPIHTMGDERTNITFYDDVVVSDECRIGEVNGGWQVMGVALGLERGVMGGTGEGWHLWEQFREWARATVDGRGVTRLEDPAVRAALARCRIDNEVSWLLAQRSAYVAATGGVPSVEGSMAKLFATQAFQRATRDFQDLAGAEGLLRPGAEHAVVGGEVERAARHAPVTTIYGGTSEIQRNNIALRHLGLPRPPSA
ncbi:MAG: acyl-CoA dehydrogenase family protein [Acidimicrobiales bacterium]